MAEDRNETGDDVDVGTLSHEERHHRFLVRTLPRALDHATLEAAAKERIIGALAECDSQITTPDRPASAWMAENRMIYEAYADAIVRALNVSPGGK